MQGACRQDQACSVRMYLCLCERGRIMLLQLLPLDSLHAKPFNTGSLGTAVHSKPQVMPLLPP